MFLSSIFNPFTHLLKLSNNKVDLSIQFTDLHFGGRYLLLISCVLRNIKSLIRRDSSDPLSSPSSISAGVASGCRDATIGPSYTLLKAPLDPRNMIQSYLLFICTVQIFIEQDSRQRQLLTSGVCGHTPPFVHAN